MPWPCFWLDPAGTAALGLRRYARTGDWHGAAWTCEAGWHQGFAWRGMTAPARVEEDDGHRHHAAAAKVGHGDPAWPAQCARGCGYEFDGDDEWQEWEEPLYRRAGTGQMVILHTGFGAPPGTQVAGPGAMWDGWWLPAGWKGADGIGLMVRCPAPGAPAERSHDWIVDGPSTSGGQWTRTGDPRHPETLTVSPSIAAGDPAAAGYYHGFLQAGVLTDHAG